jgi:hypothetical protein
MATRALAADNEAVANTETYVSSALAFPVRTYLPEVNAGSGATVALDYEIRFETTAGGNILILTFDGDIVGLVPSRSQAVVVARTGAAQSERDRWNFQPLPQTPAAFTAVTSTYDATEITALRTCLINAGLMKAE